MPITDRAPPRKRVPRWGPRGPRPEPPAARSRVVLRRAADPRGRPAPTSEWRFAPSGRASASRARARTQAATGLRAGALRRPTPRRAPTARAPARSPPRRTTPQTPPPSEPLSRWPHTGGSETAGPSRQTTRQARPQPRVRVPDARALRAQPGRSGTPPQRQRKRTSGTAPDGPRRSWASSPPKV